MAKVDYAEKLKDPRWQKKRLEVMNRDEWSCQACGSDSKTLNVHHLYYEMGLNPWEYPLECYKTLCENCHELEHDLADNSTSYNAYYSEFLLLRIVNWRG